MWTAGGTNGFGVNSSSSSSCLGFRHNWSLFWKGFAVIYGGAYENFTISPSQHSAPTGFADDTFWCRRASTSKADSSCTARCHIYRVCRTVCEGFWVIYSFLKELTANFMQNKSSLAETFEESRKFVYMKKLLVTMDAPVVRLKYLLPCLLTEISCKWISAFRAKAFLFPLKSFLVNRRLAKRLN